jgi:hypothetical protein
LGIRAGSGRIVHYYSGVLRRGRQDRAMNPLVGLIGQGVETVLEVEAVANARRAPKSSG